MNSDINTNGGRKKFAERCIFFRLFFSLQAEVILSLVACGRSVIDGMHRTDVIAAETSGAIIAPSGAQSFGIAVRLTHGDITERTVRGTLATAHACLRDSEP